MTEREACELALGAQLSALLSDSRALSTDAAAHFHPSLQPAAFDVVRWLHSFGPANLVRVADGLAMDRSSTSKLVAELKRSGILHAKPDPHDRRSAVLSLTKDGAKRLDAALAHKNAVFRQRIRDWSQEDLAQLTGLLRRFNLRPANGKAASTTD